MDRHIAVDVVVVAGTCALPVDAVVAGTLHAGGASQSVTALHMKSASVKISSLYICIFQFCGTLQ